MADERPAVQRIAERDLPPGRSPPSGSCADQVLAAVVGRDHGAGGADCPAVGDIGRNETPRSCSVEMRGPESASAVRRRWCLTADPRPPVGVGCRRPSSASEPHGGQPGEDVPLRPAAQAPVRAAVGGRAVCGRRHCGRTSAARTQPWRAVTEGDAVGREAGGQSLTLPRRTAVGAREHETLVPVGGASEPLIAHRPPRAPRRPAATARTRPPLGPRLLPGPGLACVGGRRRGPPPGS